MKFKHFLLTENRSKKITEAQFEKLKEQNCGDIIKKYKSNKRTFIYRGIESYNDYLYINPTIYTRKSAYAEYNYYTILLDEILPSWKNWPKRSKSIVCTTKQERADVYGNRFLVFPFNNSKIGVCSDDDIWNSFKRFDKLDDLNNIILNAFRYFKLSKQQSKENLTKLLNTLTDHAHNDQFIETSCDFATLYQFFRTSKHHDFILYLDELLDPKKNGFELLKPSTMKSYDNREIWIEGECLLLNYSIFDGI